MTDERPSPPDEPLLDEETRSALPSLGAPDGFADRVMARLAEKQAAPRRDADPVPPRRPAPRLAYIAGGITLTAVAALAIWGRALETPERGKDAGQLVAERRSTLPVGPRGVAVVEAGGAIAFATEGERTVVEQTAGDVFYRVTPSSDPDAGFVVRTPAGDVVVRGTCFRVEVIEMKGLKQALGGAALGAGVTAAVLVTVYEGKVRFANAEGATEVAAGERAVARVGDAPGPVVDVAPRAGNTPGASTALAEPPSPTATREELLGRDEAHRRELVTLRARVHQLESTAASAAAKPGEKSADERPFFDPSPEELKAMAARCELRWDHPQMEPEEESLSPEQAMMIGLSDEERRTLNKAHHDFQLRNLATLRQIYLEVTGDTNGAEELSATSLFEEINRKSSPVEIRQVYQRLSAERAGLAVPPTDLSKASPYERMMRMATGLGNETEKLAATVLGPERAHRIRAEQGGWGSRHTSNHGCPEE
jgi:hypothetical protein